MYQLTRQCEEDVKTRADVENMIREQRKSIEFFKRKPVSEMPATIREQTIFQIKKCEHRLEVLEWFLKVN